MTLSERLTAAFEANGMTNAEGVKLLVSKGIASRATIYNILSERTSQDKVWAETVFKIAKALKVDAQWLHHGTGEMRPAVILTDDAYTDVLGYAQAAGLSDGEEMSDYQETHSLKFKRTSLSGKRLNARNLAVIYGKGDSMLPRIHDGDAILFDTADTRPRDGSLFVILVPGINGSNYSVKRCMELDDVVYFDALNPAGDHQWKKPKRMDAKKHPIQIIGRVRWVGSWVD